MITIPVKDTADAVQAIRATPDRAVQIRLPKGADFQKFLRGVSFLLRKARLTYEVRDAKALTKDVLYIRKG